MLATIFMTILVFMFFVIMFIVYFDYMLSIVRLSSCSCISLYSAHSLDPGVSGRHCVSISSTIARDDNLVKVMLRNVNYIR